jgi:nucleoside phosphorylase
MNNEEITVLRQAFEDAVPKVEDHPLWRVLRARVRTFTLSIGCPSSNNDPLDCITALRRHLSLRAWTLENTATQSNSGTQNTTQHSHDDYTACWISPMEVEQIAAMEMLDEEHERLPQPRTDQNVYTLGSIAGHNVVIAGLPLTGNNPAATVATQAMETFRNLRFCLLVGIGGAVPTATDNGLIRLGDVIVNKPAAQHSGVIQYDRGKAEDGFFQRTGALPPPPRVLLSAAQSLATKRARSSTDPIKENIKRIDIKIRGLARYQYPGLIYDHLYPSHYVHRQPGRACEDCGCDPAERLERSFGNEDDGPVITVHRGTIASGEIIMKSGTLRDSLAEQYGILCFETEAAGVSATLPCMVIRGISDYSDSHKDDRWHGYAAATAAAYAREIFFHMPLEQAQTTL